MNLRNRFTVFFVAFAILVTTLEGVLTWSTARDHLEGALEQRLLAVAGVAATLNEDLRLRSYLQFLAPGQESGEEWTRLQSSLQVLANEFVDDAAIFSWMPGEFVAHAIVTRAPPDSVGIGQELSWVQPYLFEEVPRADREGTATTEPVPGPDGRVYMYGILRLGDHSVLEEGEEGEAGVFLGVRLRADHLQPLNNLRWTIVGVSLAATALAALIAWALAGGIVARLQTLSRAALLIQRGWMDRPIRLEGEDELSRLARAMERMRSGIQRRDEQMRLMLSQVAHEIRNPLGGLELFSAAAMDTEDPAERRRILERVRNEVVSLNGIINEFLGFARPGASNPTLHDIRQPIREACHLTEAELARAGGTLQIDLPEDELAVLADPAQVKRIVLNLLRNGAQAADNVRVSAESVRGQVRVAVSDDGPGIPDDLRERIFEPFVGDKEKGAGLGLAIVRKLVQANGGRVEALPRAPDSGTGAKGAEFHLYFRGAGELPDKGPPMESSGGGGG